MKTFCSRAEMSGGRFYTSANRSVEHSARGDTARRTWYSDNGMQLNVNSPAAERWYI